MQTHQKTSQKWEKSRNQFEVCLFIDFEHCLLLTFGFCYFISYRHTFTIYTRQVIILCFPGGVGAHVWVQPAELLDDSVPETAGCQAAVTAHAGTVQSKAARTHRNMWKLFVLFENCTVDAGSGGRERVSQPVVQNVGSALPAHPGSSSSDNWGPSTHDLLRPQEGLQHF